MRFEKIQEIILHVGGFGGFVLIRKILCSEDIRLVSDLALIADIIHSKYHHWQGEEEPNGLIVNMSTTDKYGKSRSWTLTNHKFYGFFDNSKIKVSHYKKIIFDEFYKRIINAIEKEIEDASDFLIRTKNTISENLNRSSVYYFLDLDPEKNKGLVAEWQVYDFFYAFISIDRPGNCINLIEFGLD